MPFLKERPSNFSFSESIMTAPYADQELDKGNSTFFKLLLLTGPNSVPIPLLTELNGGYAAALWLIQFPSAGLRIFLTLYWMCMDLSRNICSVYPKEQ